jgi:predicted phage terminase large subunit-like protein
MFKGYMFKGISSSGRGGKVIRAKPFSAAVENGLVYLVRGTWNASFIAELSQFPDPKTHDDIVDAAANAYSHLSSMAARGKINLSKMVMSRNSFTVSKRNI